MMSEREKRAIAAIDTKGVTVSAVATDEKNSISVASTLHLAHVCTPYCSGLDVSETRDGTAAPSVSPSFHSGSTLVALAFCPQSSP